MQTNLKYSLTRLCLRGGQMTLSSKMMQLFPDAGNVRALDTVKNTDYSLELRDKRLLTGLADFYRTHHMDVNDVVVVSPLEDGRFALTPVVRPKEPTMSDGDLAQLLAYKVLELNAPLSAAELKELFPHLPKDTDVDRLLMSDIRLVKQGGRWTPRRRESEEAARAQPRPETPAVKAFELRPDAPSLEPHNLEPHNLEPQEKGAETPAPDGAETLAQARPEGPAAPSDDDFVFVPKDHARSRVTVTPYPRGVMFPGETAAEGGDDSVDFSLNRKARAFLQDFGYRVEGLSHAQLLAHADLGRHHYNALIHLHPDDARLDWAALLARRRDSKAHYVAVFGRQHDLQRLVSPAELARATLWSWEGLERAHVLLQTLPISPYDLEAHFKREGLFQHGLERFEAAIGKRIAERGHFSAVIGRLAALKAPSIFLLEDVIADLDAPRDQVVKVLEVLAHPPFQMVAKVADGEFCLRYPVAQGLLQLSEYALSLRDRLPNRRHERLRGIEDDEEAQRQETAGRPKS
ncbi:MAG: hypothetical protein M3498_16330 [Deinococcota bacterium]|jgi:hypothetical protein|nr:hypothetical protein [Deinococcota bacterium]